MATIGCTKFAAGRHFNPSFAGTKIGDLSVEDFVARLQKVVDDGAELAAGYAPFCKHVFVENFTDARAGVVAITPDNEHLLKSGYKARRPEELPVLERWFAGLQAPRAAYLDVILYSREQLEKEASEMPAADRNVPDADWSIVSINGGPLPEEAPIAPLTMLRNALGKSEGGSGVELDRDAYLRSVEFWNRHARVA